MTTRINNKKKIEKKKELSLKDKEQIELKKKHEHLVLITKYQNLNSKIRNFNFTLRQLKKHSINKNTSLIKEIELKLENSKKEILKIEKKLQGLK